MAKDYDPPMHTAEHVLNQTMIRLFQCERCFSSHLNPKKSKCDYYFSRPLDEQEARTLEDQVNAILDANLPVTEELLPYAAAKAVMALDRLPQGQKTPTTVRIVRIGDYDVCPCIGAHVSSTREVGHFHLISHSFTPPEPGSLLGVLRLRFNLKSAPV